MADNALRCIPRVLSAVPVVVEGVRLIVSPFQVIEMKRPELARLILRTVAERGTGPTLTMDDENRRPAEGYTNWGDTKSPQERQQYVNLLHEFEDVLAVDYQDMKGIPPEMADTGSTYLPNTRPLEPALPVETPNYAERVKKELDKLLEARFIYR
ncbi:hypothetical protein R1flu_022986 [Riccia fluitans]|uniref:Uncharacterized protein n=1 Tax=Riccia fluitans TaxID=41844 RepID=A0ABD1XR97_9MARC